MTALVQDERVDVPEAPDMEVGVAPGPRPGTVQVVVSGEIEAHGRTSSVRWCWGDEGPTDPIEAGIRSPCNPCRTRFTLRRSARRAAHTVTRKPQPVSRRKIRPTTGRRIQRTSAQRRLHLCLRHPSVNFTIASPKSRAGVRRRQHGFRIMRQPPAYLCVPPTRFRTTRTLAIAEIVGVSSWRAGTRPSNVDAVRRRRQAAAAAAAPTPGRCRWPSDLSQHPDSAGRGKVRCAPARIRAGATCVADLAAAKPSARRPRAAWDRG